MSTSPAFNNAVVGGLTSGLLLILSWVKYSHYRWIKRAPRYLPQDLPALLQGSKKSGVVVVQGKVAVKDLFVKSYDGKKTPILFEVEEYLTRGNMWKVTSAGPQAMLPFTISSSGSHVALNHPEKAQGLASTLITLPSIQTTVSKNSWAQYLVSWLFGSPGPKARRITQSILPLDSRLTAVGKIEWADKAKRDIQFKDSSLLITRSLKRYLKKQKRESLLFFFFGALAAGYAVYNLRRWLARQWPRPSLSLPRFLSPENDDDDDTYEGRRHGGGLCCVCLEREVQVVFAECRHACICERCSRSIMQLERRCPICRTYITEREKIFLSGTPVVRNSANVGSSAQPAAEAEHNETVETEDPQEEVLTDETDEADSQ